MRNYAAEDNVREEWDFLCVCEENTATFRNLDGIKKFRNTQKKQAKRFASKKLTCHVAARHSLPTTRKRGDEKSFHNRFYRDREKTIFSVIDFILGKISSFLSLR
jgi:hypothetical protein